MLNPGPAMWLAIYINKRLKNLHRFDASKKNTYSHNNESQH